MCSQFETTEREDVIERLGINSQSNLVGSANWGTIYPQYNTLLIICDNEPIVRSWGLTPEWSTRPIINAKSEEADKKKTFLPLLNNRCIIPATSYYEWQGEKGSRYRTNIFGNTLFSIAGLYNEQQYIMFTCSAAESIKHIHHRMPAILQDEEISDWLDPHKNYVDVKNLLCPFSGLLKWKHV